MKYEELEQIEPISMLLELQFDIAYKNQDVETCCEINRLCLEIAFAVQDNHVW